MAQTQVGIKLTLDGAQQVEQGVRRVISSVDSLGTQFTRLGQLAAGAFSVRELVTAADAYATLTGRIKLASEGLGDAAQAQKQLFDIANTARTSVEGLSNTYASLARAAGESGRSQAELLRTTDTLAKAMTIGGGAAESQKAALMQFAQGLSAGTLRGEELNSVMEQAPRLAKALADGLGVPIGALKTMGEQGRITTDAIFEALERSRAKIEQEFSQLPTTIGQALTVLNNSFMQTIGVFDEANKISSGFADAILGIGKNMDVVVPTVGAMAAGLVVLRTSATAAALATGALGTAVSALGGPIGLIATALGIGATAWMAWKGAATDSEKAVETQVINSDAEIQARIDAQIGKLRERNRLAVAGMPEARSGVERAAADAGDLYARQLSRYQQIKSGAGEFAGLPDGTRAALLQASAKSLAKAYSQYTELTAEVATQAETKNRESFLNFTKGYKSAQDKAKEELAKYEKEFKPKIGIGITKSEYDAGYKAIEERTKKTTAATNRLNTEYEQQQKLLAELSGLSGSFAQDWDNLSGIYAKGGLSIDQLTAAQAALLEKQPAIKAASDEEKKAQELLTQSYQDAAAERLKNVESMEKSADGLVSQNQALRDEIELIGLTEEQQTRVLQMRNEAIILTKEATLAELERANAITGTMTREQIALAAEIEALKERNELLGAKSVKNTAAEAAKKAEDEWKKTTDQINESLTDALMRGFESGKDFAKNMRDTVTNMFKTMVLRPTISAILAPVAGGVTGLLGLSGAANAGQGAANAGQGAGSLMGMASIASSAYNLVSGGLNVASQAGTWLSGKGTELALQYMGESAGTLLNNFALGMSSTSSMSAASAALQGVGADIAGLAVGSVLNGFSGYGISSALSGGYSAGGWVNTVAGIASAIPGVGPIAGVVGGAVNRAFGRKHTQTNLQGTFGGETGFEGRYEDYYKGGWLRSGKSVYSPVDEETRGALAGQFNAMRVATAAMADVLGLGTDAISNFTASVNIKLKGLSAEDAQKKIQEEFDKIAESLARQTLGSDAFSRAGESSVQTLIRLSSSLTTVNSAFKMLDIEARDMQFANSLTGGKNASEYLDKFGGADVFNQLTASYYDAFYSEAEKTANVTKSITETLASVGLAMPTTREAFRDLTNEYLAMGIYGAETAAVLLGLSGAFASIVPVTEAVTESVQAMTQSLDDYISKTARSSTEAARIRGLASVGNNAALARLGIPGYASGGYHPGGLRLVGEDGPELEVTGPSQIISSPVTADLLRGGGADTARLEALVEKLTAEVANLRAETRAVVTHTATTARIIKRVTPDGDAIATREAAPV